jgi:TetR/AcrR family transcriptional regulator, lmrAB and yxaGH operons repressor
MKTSGSASAKRLPKSTPAVPATVAVNDPAADDTRSRILRAALRLFRHHGYHGVGINQILVDAAAPKGSMYHHFPGGKEEIGAAVVGLITHNILAQIDAPPQHLQPATMMARVGAAMAGEVQRTRHELCALFAAFVAERASAPLLAQAVGQAYADIAAGLAVRLLGAGQGVGQGRTAKHLTATEAHRRAQLVVMLLEGGSLIAAAQGSIAPFKLAVQQAVVVCKGG